MTVTSAVCRVSQNIPSFTPGVSLYFFPFRIYAASDLAVSIVQNSTGNEFILAPTFGYTVFGVGDRNGGYIMPTAQLTPFIPGVLTIRRVRPLTQLLNLRNQGPMFPANVEDGLDQQTMLSQQLNDDFLRAVKLADATDPTFFDTRLPANLVAGNAIVVNAGSNGFSMAALSAATLSAWSATHNETLDVFTSGFTPGVTTQLTLSAPPGSNSNIDVKMRVLGTDRLFMNDEFSISGTTLTFTSPIPAVTTRIEVKYLFTYQVNTVLAANVIGTTPLSQAAYTNSVTGAVTSNVQAKLDSILPNVKADFGAVGDGSTDDRAAFLLADVTGGFAVPAGTYKIASNMNLTSAVFFAPGAVLTPTAGTSITFGGTSTINAGLYRIFNDVAAGSAIVMSMVAPLVVYPQWWGAVGDGSTDDTLPCKSAVTACPEGCELVCVGSYLVTGVGTEIFLRTLGFTLRGVGSLAGFTLGSGMGATTDVFRFKPASSAHNLNWRVRDLTFKPQGGSVGQHTFNLDTNAANLRFDGIVIERCFTFFNSGNGYFVKTTLGAGLGVNNPVFRDNAIDAGFSLIGVGEMARVLNNVIKGPLEGVLFDPLANAFGGIISGNKMTSSQGGVIMRSGTGVVIADNLIEQTVTTAACIDLQGTSFNIVGTVIRGNFVFALGVNAHGLHINSASQTYIEGNPSLQGAGTGNGINITANADATTIGMGNGVFGGITDGGTHTVQLYVDSPNSAVQYVGPNGTLPQTLTPLRVVASGVANAITGSGPPLQVGLRLLVTIATTLQAGANTFAYNGGAAIAIKSHRVPANDIGAAYAGAHSVIDLAYGVTGANIWVDMSQ